jgi:hypothetical protein
VAGQRPEQVLGVEVQVAPLAGLPRGGGDHLAGVLAEQLGDVDPLHAAAGTRTAEERLEEVVERAAEGAARETAGHQVMAASRVVGAEPRCPPRDTARRAAGVWAAGLRVSGWGAGRPVGPGGEGLRGK